MATVSLGKRIDQLKKEPFDSKEKRLLWNELQVLNKKTELPPAEMKEIVAKFGKSPNLPSPTLYDFVRFIGFVLAWMVAWPFLMMIGLLRPLHYVLRKIGIKNGKLPLDIAQRWFGKYIMLVLGINVEVRGKENVSTLNGSPTLGFFTHGSNLDSFIIVANSPITFKWIGKQSLLCVPFFGPLALVYGSVVGIDRTNREKAIKSLAKAKSNMDKWGRSIAISPEGTRTKNGQLQEFKKGAFHLAKQCQVPLVPILLFGAYEKLPPGRHIPRPGTVVLHFAPQIAPQEYQDDDYNQLLEKTHKKILTDLCDLFPEGVNYDHLPRAFQLQHYFALGFTYVAICFMIYFISSLNIFS